MKHDGHGYPLPDRTKGMIFLKQAKIAGNLEDHIMAKTNGSRNFSDLPHAIQILARRPMSQVSSSFPSYYDEWDDSTSATEYYDIDDHNAVDNDGYYDEYENPRTMTMSGSTCLASLRTLRSKSRSWPACWRVSRRANRVSGEARKAGAIVSPVMF